ncbi:hypothetical protein [Cohnella sp.]|uniref:hypothetical protein n=1 Tax=Cohnella sp. TaxID=1883426 RepID=UPI003565C30B
MLWGIIITITIIGLLFWWGLSRAVQIFRSYVKKPIHYVLKPTPNVIKPSPREFIIEFSEEVSSINSDAVTENSLPEPEPEPEISFQQYLDEIKQTEMQYQEEILNSLSNNLSHASTELANIQIQMQDLQILCAILDDFQQIELSYQQIE